MPKQLEKPVPFKLPPDPEGMNESRAWWAELAVCVFQRETGADDEDALADLLCDLMHWADRCGYGFEDDLRRARSHYVEETRGNEAEHAASVPDTLTDGTAS